MSFLLLLPLIIYSSAIILPMEDLDTNDVYATRSVYKVKSSDSSVEGYISGDPLWVLHLNNDGWMDPKLTLGSSDDQEDFYYAVAPRITQAARDTRTTMLNNRQKPNTTQQISDSQNTPSDRDLKNDIMKIINKFALSTSLEPDSYLTGNADQKDPSIALYFKGPISCFIVILGDKQWHYILQTKPFPAWFYESHDTFYAPLKIPENLRNTFFKVLLRLLKLMLSYPI